MKTNLSLGTLFLLALAIGSTSFGQNSTISMSDFDYFPQNTPAAEIGLKVREVPYPTVKVRPAKLEEDKQIGIIFLTPEQREEHRVIITNGIIYDLHHNVYSDTSNKKGMINYVMDANGNFYLFDEFTTPPLLKHSSIFAGGPVAGGGDLAIKGGKIIFIDTDSGHYPTKELFPNVLGELAADGVDISHLPQRPKN